MGRPVVLTGGGTGGHLFPMIAIADALVARGLDAREVRFVGSRRGKDRELLGERANPTTLLPGRGIVRSFALRDVARNVVSTLELGGALVAALYLMVKWRPRAVVSLGGYAALAVDLAAVVTRTPLVLVVPDATYGGTHRIVRRFAAARCTALTASDAREVVTGTPLRDEIRRVDRSSSRLERLKVSGGEAGRWSLVVMTGSLGASSVNRAVLALAELWRERSDLTLTHVTGQRDFAAMSAAWHSEPSDSLEYHQVPFADMAPLWARADVAICRAGASSVAELAALGIPSVLVPLPGAPGDHQSVNARELQQRGGAIVVRDDELSAARLAEVIEPLLSDPRRLIAMSLAARSAAHDDAANAISVVVLDVARG